jgi:hypothetical protein
MQVIDRAKGLVVNGGCTGTLPCRISVEHSFRGSGSVVVDTVAVDGDRERVEASWKRTREHLAAARAELSALPAADLSDTDEMLSHNELGLAFDCLVDLGDSSDLGRFLWEHLDLAAREMGWYGAWCAARSGNL